MTRKYIRWTKETLEPIVNSSQSYAECLRKMCRQETGGNYKNLQRNIDKFGLDTSHMKHQAHNAGKEFKKFDELQSNKAIKGRLIKENGHSCYQCGLHTWQKQKITLELDHIDGDNRNNSKENLRLLCPNCHSLTPTWRNKKRS